MEVDEATWDKFKRHARARQQLAPLTVASTIRKLRYLERHGIDLINFDEDKVYDFFASRLDDGTEPSTLNNYIKALNRWCRFMGLDIKFKEYREYEKPLRVPTHEEIKAMIDVFNRRTKEDRLKRMIIVTLAETGMRNSELCNLQKKNIDWTRRELLVYGKGGGMRKPRIIPAREKFLFGIRYPSLSNFLKNWRYSPAKGHEQYVFLNKKGRRIESWYVRKVVKEAGRAIGAEWIHPHSFRHYFATNLLRNGANIRIVQQILGHKKLETTARYLHFVEADLHAAIEKIDDPVRIKPKERLQRKRGDLYTLYNSLSIKNYGPGGI